MSLALGKLQVDLVKLFRAKAVKVFGGRDHPIKYSK